MDDLSLLIGAEKLPHSAWADAYRRSTTPSQNAKLQPIKPKRWWRR